MIDKRSKDSDDPQKASTGNAVDRASSVTPLGDDEDIDPATISGTVRSKQQAAHAKPDNPQAGPGPVRAKPNVADRDDKGSEPTPRSIEYEIENSPKERAKEAAKDENVNAAIKNAGE